jgi:tetratricopeptide (TPR) repeat protein
VSLPAEVIGPTQAWLLVATGAGPGHLVPVLAALTVDAVWIQEVYRMRRLPLGTLGNVAPGTDSCELHLAPSADSQSETLVLRFASAFQAAGWRQELQTQRQAADTAPEQDRTAPEGVAMVRKPPEVAHVALGTVSYTDRTEWTADRGLQLRAGMRGADAIINLRRERCPEVGMRGRTVSGLAVRVDNPADRDRIRLRWYSEEVYALCNSILLLLVAQAALLFLASYVCAGAARFEMPTGETATEALISNALALAMVYAWPLCMLVFLRFWRWPSLLRTTAIAVLAATTGRGLTVWLAHLSAAQATAGAQIWVLLDPIGWLFVIVGAAIALQAWRLAGDAQYILPPQLQVASKARKIGTGGLLAGTVVYAVAVLSLIAVYRYQASMHVMQPGVDPQREQEGLLAMNEGAAQANGGDLAAAEKSFQKSLRIWEDLTRGPSVPVSYRVNHAIALADMGWLRERQERADEAEKYYAEAVAMADKLAGGPPLDPQFEKTMANARLALMELRGNKTSKELEDKEKQAVHKFEQGQVKVQTSPAEAEGLYQEAIGLWEEILPQATNEKYRSAAPGNLASAYRQLGEVQRLLGKRPQAEATFQKAITLGEQALRLDPDRPLARHNLDMARRAKASLREQALLDEINRLNEAQRFADALAVCTGSVSELEKEVRQAKDPEATRSRLAFRVDRLAWFLAHCPDAKIRDTKAAVMQARRATELQPDMIDYLYTLATAQYRNGDWRDCLASLDNVKGREGDLDAGGWFLVAMSKHQLKEQKESRMALRQAIAWLEAFEKQAKFNAVLRFQLEMMLPGLQALRREAETLIDGKAAAASHSPNRTTPLVPSTVTTCPSANLVSTPRTDITAGKPISRAVTAPWDRGPPLSVMSPEAL